ncbi:MAG: mono/diheme cytochrome c family protein [Candidatus Azotimanducaceae bacterium]
MKQALLLLVCLSVFTSKVSASDALSLNEGVFTKQQAKSGKRLYKKHCSSCHEGNYFKSVLLTWKGEALTELYGIITSEMPENDPGALAGDQYIEILAYILSSNKYPAGETRLDSGSTAFSQFIIK